MTKWTFEREFTNDESPYEIGEQLYFTSSSTGNKIRGLVTKTENGKLREVWISSTRQLIRLKEEIDH